MSTFHVQVVASAIQEVHGVRAELVAGFADAGRTGTTSAPHNGNAYAPRCANGVDLALVEPETAHVRV
jgi:hypothetical protein